MAQCKQTAQEFIQNTFNPHVAVLCSPDAEVLCQKNNLTFVELVQPFCHLTTEGGHFFKLFINRMRFIFIAIMLCLNCFPYHVFTIDNIL